MVRRMLRAQPRAELGGEDQPGSVHWLTSQPLRGLGYRWALSSDTTAGDSGTLRRDLATSAR